MSLKERFEELELHLIVFDKELQVRVETDQETVHDYYEAMATEEDMYKFPPPTVYFDGFRYWLADGHHRYWAAHRRGYKKMRVKVIDGSHDDALLAAVKLNSQNGLRFKDGDWEKIILLITGKDQWKNWSNRTLATELGCCDYTIRKYRVEDSGACAHAPEKRQGKDGKMYPAKMKRKRHRKNRSTEVGGSPTPAVQTDEPVPPNSVAAPPVSEEVADPILQPAPADETSDVLERFTERECLVEEKNILMEISALTERINRYFDRAPEEHHDRFADRLRTCIRAMID